MGQKIHPIGFRLGITQEHRSRWYADTRRYSEVLKEDYIIRQHIERDTTLATAGISKVTIERKADQIELAIHTARPLFFHPTPSVLTYLQMSRKHRALRL